MKRIKWKERQERRIKLEAPKMECPLNDSKAYNKNTFITKQHRVKMSVSTREALSVSQ